jgi:hypothetical protein
MQDSSDLYPPLKEKEPEFGHAEKRKKKSSYSILMEETHEKRSLEGPRCKCENIIKRDLMKLLV